MNEVIELMVVLILIIGVLSLYNCIADYIKVRDEREDEKSNNQAPDDIFRKH